ncbi:TetR/AcrR family transcriptional regulator [Burkholderia cepacia]|uniref:TetR/AcrR family transcriptional regulator n=1 Tax=Burkholderia cepacia TaxID=292 RepID=UPI002AB70866|nr:TetR/AcrR family transcriptional regulator [Burkholderia cepacia]
MTEKYAHSDRSGRLQEKPISLREQQKLITQKRLIEAAVRVFLERGCTDSTVDDIVAAAAVGRATFYLHFKNKLEVMRALIREMGQQNEHLIEELRSWNRPTRVTVESWVQRFVQHWLEEGDRFLVGLQALASEPELSGEFEAGIQLATTVLTKLLEKGGGMPTTEAQLRANLLVGALQQACRALVREPDRYSVSLVVRVITEIWVTNLGV